ncbi:hypothetical protein [Rubritalea sp.]|uniref:hypothetical protein n=1 Tax=Rubritalea sp. TaxID=2109375 RepID=UPI003EF5073A
MTRLLTIALALTFTSSIQASDDRKAERKPDIIVVDEAGTPIHNAEVQAVTPSTNGEWLKSNKKGHANFGWHFQTIEWVSARKVGYNPIVDQQFKGVEKPVKIILTKKFVLKN